MLLSGLGPKLAALVPSLLPLAAAVVRRPPAPAPAPAVCSEGAGAHAAHAAGAAGHGGPDVSAPAAARAPLLPEAGAAAARSPEARAPWHPPPPGGGGGGGGGGSGGGGGGWRGLWDSAVTELLRLLLALFPRHLLAHLQARPARPGRRAGQRQPPGAEFSKLNI